MDSQPPGIPERRRVSVVRDCKAGHDCDQSFGSCACWDELSKYSGALLEGENSVSAQISVETGASSRFPRWNLIANQGKLWLLARW